MVSPLLVPVIGGIVETVGKVADDLFTSDEEKQRLELDLYNAETERAKIQTDINVEEAKSSSIFVSGARPAIMWICAFAMGYATVLEPLMRFISQVMVGYTGAFPVIDTELTMQVLFGLLGLGAYRTFEKMKGVASK